MEVDHDMNKIIYLITLVLFLGCNSEGIKEQIEETIQDIKEVVKPFPVELTNDLKDYLKKGSKESKLSLFYSNKKEFIWFNSDLELKPKGKELITLLSSSQEYGIDTLHFQIKKVKHLIKSKNYVEAELFLTQSYMNFGRLISYGQIEDVSDYYSFERRVLDTNWLAILDSGINRQTEIIDLLSYQPQSDEYVRLQKGVSNYVKRVVLNDSTIKIREYRKDSIKTYQRARKALVLHGVIMHDSISDSLLIEGVKKFQYEHGLTPDGVIGKGTAKELSRSTNYFYKQAKVSLEKWRWTKEFEKEHIFVNIATYKMKCYQNNKVEEIKRVVVGTNTTRTPELDSKLNYMIAYPYWHVPRSIIEGELVAKAKKDSTYLSRNGYELFKGSEAVNSKKIDWSAGSNYKFRQKGGRSNALGHVKFIFPNKHSVYFHDTPSKRFFKKGRRSYSHGCIRVHEPLKLVDYLLKTDSASRYSLDTVETFIKNKTRKVVTLNKKMPVHIRYYTVEADSASNIRFYPDVYSKEKKLMKYKF